METEGQLETRSSFRKLIFFATVASGFIAAAEKSGLQHIFVEQDPPIAGMTSLEAVAISYKTLRPIV